LTEQVQELGFKVLVASCSVLAMLSTPISAADAASSNVRSAAPLAESRAPGCTGMGCNGKDPNEMQCDGASTLATQIQPNASWRAELRYSSQCQSYWVRHRKVEDTGLCNETPKIVNLQNGVRRADGTVAVQSGVKETQPWDSTGCINTYWTPMLNAVDRIARFRAGNISFETQWGPWSAWKS
jgi:hypothetical protein